MILPQPSADASRSTRLKWAPQPSALLPSAGAEDEGRTVADRAGLLASRRPRHIVEPAFAFGLALALFFFFAFADDFCAAYAPFEPMIGAAGRTTPAANAASVAATMSFFITQSPE